MPTRLLLDGSDIEILLGEVNSRYGEQARIVHAERVRTGGIAGFFAKERYEVAVEIDDGPPPRSSRLAMPASHSQTPSNGDESVALLVAEAMNQSDGNLDEVFYRSPSISTSGPAFAGVMESLHSAIGLDGAQVDRVPAPVPAEIGSPARTVTSRTEEPRLANPPRPPRGAGQVLAVVGEAALAFDAGLMLARRMRIPATRVLLASPDQTVPGLVASRRLTNATSARKRSLRLLAETTPSVVAVDLPIGAIWDDEAVDWAQEVVDALGAKTVWAMVDATRKGTDLARWLGRLGSVDALLVHNASITQDLLPLSRLGYPVAMLDDRPATAAVWRSMLSADVASLKS